MTINFGNDRGSLTGRPVALFGVGTKLDICNDYIEQFWGVKTVTDGTRITYWTRSPSPAPTVSIKKVIFNDPATIVFWADGTKTVVKCADFDIFDPEKGLAMAICKRVYGEEFHKIFKDFLPEEDEESEYPNIPLSNWFNDVAEAARNMANAFSMNKEDK